MPIKFFVLALYAVLSFGLVSTPTASLAEQTEEAFLVLFHTGDAKLQSKDPASALDLFRKARHIRNTPKLEINIAICLFELARYDAALSALESALLFENLDEAVRDRANKLQKEVLAASLSFPPGTNFRVLLERKSGHFTAVLAPKNEDRM